MKVTFFPRNDYPNNIEVCTHRLGKKITMCETTTMIPYWVSRILLPYVVQLHQTHNVRVGAYFDWRNNLNPAATHSSYLDEYVMEQISDNVIYPELYFLSDPVSDYSEEAQEKSKQKNWNWFQEKFGRNPPAMLFGLMPGPYGDYMRRYILSGDSNATSNDTDYGLGVGNPNNRPYSHSGEEDDFWFHRNWNRRPLDYGLNDDSYAPRIEELSSFIDSVMALPKGGFIFNFNHWHNVLYKDINPITGEILEGREDTPAINAFKDYFDMLAEKNINGEIYFSGHGEAVAYLVYRESISKIAMYSPIGSESDKLIIRLEAPNRFDINTELLQTPISIKFTTNGTPLEGQEIHSDCNLISLNNNNYIVEIPYRKYAGAIIYKNEL